LSIILSVQQVTWQCSRLESSPGPISHQSGPLPFPYRATLYSRL